MDMKRELIAATVDSPIEADLPSTFGALQRRHDHLNQILQCTGEGIYSIDTKGRCTFCNDAVSRILGFDRDELLGENIHALIHHTRCDGSPYPSEECAVCHNAGCGSETPLDEEVLWSRDGRCVPVEFSSFSLC